MKLTIPWLKRHLNTKTSIDQIVSTLTNIGLEVEEVVKPNTNLKLFTDIFGFPRYKMVLIDASIIL